MLACGLVRRIALEVDGHAFTTRRDDLEIMFPNVDVAAIRSRGTPRRRYLGDLVAVAAPRERTRQAGFTARHHAHVGAACFRFDRLGDESLHGLLPARGAAVSSRS